MPTLSQYWFDDSYFQGMFTVRNKRFRTYASIAFPSSSEASLVRVRPDDEIIISLRDQIDTPSNRALIDAQLMGDSINRSGPIRIDPIRWKDVPYYSDNPRRHKPNSLLVRIYVNIHIVTPSYCTDADGDMSYYVVFALDDAGRLRAIVEGWSFAFSGGFGVCSGAIDDKLEEKVPTGMPVLQGLLDVELGKLTQAFRGIYILPGTGDKTPGRQRGNADTRAALVLLPQLEEL